MAVAKFSGREQSSCNIQNVKLWNTVVGLVKRNAGQTTNCYTRQFHTCQTKWSQRPWTLDPSDSTFVSHLTPRQHAAVVELVRKSCTVKRSIVFSRCTVGHRAQVSIISNDFLMRNLSGVVVKDTSELLNIELNMPAAKGNSRQEVQWSRHTSQTTLRPFCMKFGIAA